MANVIDVKMLSKEEIIHLVKDLVEEKIITYQLLQEIADINSSQKDDDEAYIESLIKKHFEEYDEVFRKLA